MNPMPPAVAHYDDQYYKDHYAQFLGDGEENRLIAAFYKRTVFDRLPSGGGRVLDYGSGPGHLSAGVAADCYDPSDFAQEFLRSRGRTVYHAPATLPAAAYDTALCSHALEHAVTPPDELAHIARALAPGGRLVLILPRERVPGPAAPRPDDNRHLYAWNFQCVTNLLNHAGYRVESQRLFYGPFLLRRLGKFLRPETAADWAARAGRWVRNYPSLFTVACLE